jgi:hypothetical protein
MSLAVVAYVNALRNPFVYDDYRSVVGNVSIQRLVNLRAIVWHDVTRPLVNFSYAVDRAVWGPGPFGFHLTSLLLHALNVGLLFVLASLVMKGRKPTIAGFTSASLFAVHPMMTEAVGYISGRAEVLCTMFLLLALIAGTGWLRRGGPLRAAATTALWLAALGAKETAAMFPFVFAAYDWLVFDHDEGRRRRLTRIHLPLMVVALGVGIGRMIVLARFESVAATTVHWNYALLDLDLIRRYAALLVVPEGQSAFHEVAALPTLFDWHAWMAVLSVALIVAAVWILRRAEPVVSFGATWFLLGLAPSSLLVLLDRGEPFAEHRVYFAACGVFLAAGAVVGRYWSSEPETADGRRRVIAAVVALLLVALTLETAQRNVVWSDPVALWREAVDLAPTHYRPRLLLGEALQDKGRRVEALDEFKTAVRLRPTDADGYVKIGLCLITMGRLQEARPYLLQALAHNPHHDAAVRALALLDRIGPNG